MAKSLMPEVAKLLGVEIGEKFKIQVLGGGNDTLLVWLTEQGLCVENNYVCNYGENKYLVKALTGELKIFKLPWEPKNGDKYFYPCPYMKQVQSETWNNHTMGYALKTLGMVYRTLEESQEHFAEDFKKLTGKDWGGN